MVVARGTWARAARGLGGGDFGHCLGEGDPRKGGALDAHGELDHALQRFEIAQLHLGDIHFGVIFDADQIGV